MPFDGKLCGVLPSQVNSKQQCACNTHNITHMELYMAIVITHKMSAQYIGVFYMGCWQIK